MEEPDLWAQCAAKGLAGAGKPKTGDGWLRALASQLVIKVAPGVFSRAPGAAVSPPHSGRAGWSCLPGASCGQEP